MGAESVQKGSVRGASRRLAGIRTANRHNSALWAAVASPPHTVLGNRAPRPDLRAFLQFFADVSGVISLSVRGAATARRATPRQSSRTRP